MTRQELEQLKTFDGVLISVGQLRAILELADKLQSGASPRGEACFDWGKLLHSIVESAEQFGEAP